MLSITCTGIDSSNYSQAKAQSNLDQQNRPPTSTVIIAGLDAESSDTYFTYVLRIWNTETIRMRQITFARICSIGLPSPNGQSIHTPPQHQFGSLSIEIAHLARLKCVYIYIYIPIYIRKWSSQLDGWWSSHAFYSRFVFRVLRLGALTVNIFNCLDAHRVVYTYV